MKILVTGMTARHTGTAVREYLTVTQPLIHILQKMGHEVTQKKVHVSEDLSEWDKIVVYLFPIEKLGTTRRFAALDTLARYPDKCIVSFDDWQYYQIQPSIRSCLNSGRFWNWVDKNPGFITKGDYDAIIAGGDEVRKRLENMAAILAEDITFPVIMPVFSWGDYALTGIKTTGEVKRYDPSISAIEWVEKNYHNIEFPPEQKKKGWVVGSLFDHSNYVKNMNSEWRKLFFGHKKTQEVLNEEELCNMYNEYWGIISPKYKTSGDGWWRSRWIFSYMFDNIMLASREECGGLPIDFVPDIKTIESMSDNHLVELAEYQKKALNAYFMPEDGVMSILSSVLK